METFENRRKESAVNPKEHAKFLENSVATLRDALSELEKKVADEKAYWETLLTRYPNDAELHRRYHDKVISPLEQETERTRKTFQEYGEVLHDYTKK